MSLTVGFLGLNLTDKIPDASTFSQHRRRRFNESEVYQQIFDKVVLQAIAKKLASGRHLFTDSTHLKANGNKNKKVNVQVSASRQDCMDALDQAVEEECLKHGKNPWRRLSKAPATR